ncbi:MAG: outer membrane beta-barrel protein [Balneolaceae bacterium]
MKIFKYTIKGTVKFITSILLFLFGIGNLIDLNAQNRDDFSRVSIILNGGATVGNVNDGFKLFRSSLNVENKTNPVFGAGIQYAVTPLWSIEGGYRYTEANALNNSFETQVNTIYLKNILNLNHLLKLNRINSFINPYLTAGAGVDFFKFESTQENFSGTEASFNAGAGLAFNVTNRFDLFTQYEYQFSANNLDNKTGGFGADILGMVTGGVRINLGGKEKKHFSWSPPPVELAKEEYNNLVADRNRLNAVESDFERMERMLAKKETELQQTQELSEAQIRDLNQQVDSLKSRIFVLESEQSDAEKQFKQLLTNLEEQETNGIPAGHYVQVFAANKLENASKVRQDVVFVLEDMESNSSEMVFITSRRGFYEVLIGEFDTVAETAGIVQLMKNRYDDAFVKTIPRPAHLKELYKDLKRVKLSPEELITLIFSGME